MAAARAARASRLATLGLAALVVAGAIGPAGPARKFAAIVGGAGLALLVIAFVVRRPIALDAALLALGAACMAALATDAPAAAAPAYGAGLLTVAQVGHRAIELRIGGTVERAALTGWLAETAAVVCAGLAASAVVLLAAAATTGDSPALRAIGAIAAAAAVSVLVLLARRARHAA